MQNVISTVTTAANNIEQIQNTGMTSHMVIALIAVIGVVSFLVSTYSLYKKIDKRVDERIDAHIKPSLELLKDTVKVVRSLEKNVAEMNATLTVLREILLTHHKQ